MPTKEENVTRKLRAILSADVKGYSLLMADDEAFTVKTLKSYRKVMSAQIVRHKGRVVDAPGDNLLAEFASVVDAVQCSVEIQKKLKEKNQDLPENKRLEFRIGVNIGDVIQDGDSLYGEGVNIAARIEGLANAGGVCISRNAYDHVKNKLTLGYEYIGEHSVKNIKDPIRVYKLLMADEDAGKLIGIKPKPVVKNWIWATIVLAAVVITSAVILVYQNVSKPEFEPAKVEEMAYPLPEKPSIAVLPFDNMTGDPEQEYFSDGLSEEIITALSIVPELYVIARNSTFTYKGKPVKVQQVSQELGVQYVLEGSVRKSGEKVRITAQLIDALKGHHLWAETYDRYFEDLFDLQEEISLKILTELRVNLTKNESTRFAAPCSENLKAYRKYMKAQDHFLRSNRQDNVIAQRLAEEAIEVDPGYACAYSLLGAIHRSAVFFGLSKSPMQSITTAKEYVEKAIELNPTLPGPHAVLALIYNSMGQYEKSFENAIKAVTLNPNSSLGNYAMGSILVYMGRSDESIEYLEKVLRLDPFSSMYHSMLGLSYFLCGRYENTIEICERAKDSRPNDIYVRLCLASGYGAGGYEEKAHAIASEIMSIDPTFSLQEYSKGAKRRFRKQADIELYLSSLRKAGIPEYPPGKKTTGKPSIAILPFDNLSDDPEQGYLADGLTDELIGDLAKIDGIFVISRNSAFTYKGKSVKIQDVAKELNVRYVLEGSVQRAGDRLRIRAQLIDGKTDHHIWAESYDGVMNDIFGLQDEITGKIVNALAVRISPDEQNKLRQKGTENILAYDAFLKGKFHHEKLTSDDLIKAVGYFDRAISIDPHFYRAFAALGEAYNASWAYAFKSFLQEMKLDARTARLQAAHYLKIAMKFPSYEAYSLAAEFEYTLRNWDEMLSYAEKCHSIAPNSADANLIMGWYLIPIGQPEKAIEYLNTAIQLDPNNIETLRNATIWTGICQFSLGQYEEAIKYIEKGLSSNPELHMYSLFLAASYAHLGKSSEAKKALENYLMPWQGYHQPSIQDIYGFWPFRNEEVFNRLALGLIKAGYPTDSAQHYKVDENNKITGEENISEIIFSHTLSGFASWGEWWREFDKKGNGSYKMIIKQTGKEISDSAIAWIEGDRVCYQFENLLGGLTNCFDTYSNPDGNAATKSEYIMIDYTGLMLFSVLD